MASRFTFTEQQFNEIKGYMAPGEKHKSYRELSEMYDLGPSTLNLISRAKDYRDYRRKSLIRSANRRVLRQQAKTRKRVAVALLALFAAIELLVIIGLVGR